MYLCTCKGILVSEAVEVAKRDNMSLDALIESLGIGEEEDTCGRCAIYKREVAQIIAIQLNRPRTTKSGNPGEYPNPTASNPSRETVKNFRWPWFHRHNIA